MKKVFAALLYSATALAFSSPAWGYIYNVQTILSTPSNNMNVLCSLQAGANPWTAYELEEGTVEIVGDGTVVQPVGKFLICEASCTSNGNTCTQTNYIVTGSLVYNTCPYLVRVGLGMAETDCYDYEKEHPGAPCSYGPSLPQLTEGCPSPTTQGVCSGACSGDSGSNPGGGGGRAIPLGGTSGGNGGIVIPGE